jgi:selenium-binding protein 1
MSDSTGTTANAASPPLDPTFYRSAAEAAAAPTEELAYVVVFDRAGTSPDALTVVDVNESSPDFGRVVGWADLPSRGDELHHFGWNACSSSLALDERFFPHGDDFRGRRVHQVRLQGGDASSDSYSYR